MGEGEVVDEETLRKFLDEISTTIAGYKQSTDFTDFFEKDIKVPIGGGEDISPFIINPEGDESDNSIIVYIEFISPNIDSRLHKYIDTYWCLSLNPKNNGLAPWLTEKIDAAEKADKICYYDVTFPTPINRYQTEGTRNCIIRIPISPRTEIKDVLDELERITPELDKEHEGISILHEQPYIVKDGVYVGYKEIKGHKMIEVNAYGGFEGPIELTDKIPQLCFVANRVGRVLRDTGYLRHADAEMYLREN